MFKKCLINIDTEYRYFTSIMVHIYQCTLTSRKIPKREMQAKNAEWRLLWLYFQ